MKRFKNILVVVNDETDTLSQPAVSRGIELARKNGARVTLMDVVKPPKHAIFKYKGIIKPEELGEKFVSRRLSELGQIAEQFGGNVDISTKVSLGHDFIEIIRQVVLEEHDLLIKTANNHPQSFDSSDFHLMRKCPEPVWLLKEKERIKSGKILAAIDLSLEDETEGKALNALIMDLATSLAEWENKEIHVLSCWSLYGENALRHSGFIKVPEEEIVELIKQEEHANYERLNHLANRYGKNDIHRHLLKGEPVKCIPQFTHDHGIETVVMGTVARSGIPGLLIGNTAETILHSLDSSVITVKPGGFVSPVK